MLISGAGTYIQSKKNHVASKFRSPSKRVHFPNSLLQIKFGVGYKMLFWYVKRTDVLRKNLKIMQTYKKAIDDRFIILHIMNLHYNWFLTCLSIFNSLPWIGVYQKHPVLHVILRGYLWFLTEYSEDGSFLTHWITIIGNYCVLCRF